jgi:TRAP-type C4-dicarboxylate transport system substrate-binding protein
VSFHLYTPTGEPAGVINLPHNPDVVLVDSKIETQGRIKIIRYPGESLVKMGDSMNAIRQGVIDIGVIHPPSATQDRFPLTSLLALPHLFSDATISSLVIQRLYEEGYCTSDFEGVHVLWRTANNPADITSKTKEIKTLQDFRGLKVGVMGDVEAVALKALGATPIPLHVTKQKTALETDIIDATWLEIRLRIMPGG